MMKFLESITDQIKKGVKLLPFEVAAIVTQNINNSVNRALNTEIYKRPEDKNK